MLAFPDLAIRVRDSSTESFSRKVGVQLFPCCTARRSQRRRRTLELAPLATPREFWSARILARIILISMKQLNGWGGPAPVVSTATTSARWRTRMESEANGE